MMNYLKAMLLLFLAIVLLILSIPFIAIGAVLDFLEKIISIAKEEFNRAKL